MDELVSRILLEYKSTQFTQPLFSEVVLIHNYRCLYVYEDSNNIQMFIINAVYK